MNDQCREMYRRTKEYFNGCILQLQDLEAAASDMDECVDTIYTIREMVTYLEESRKALNRLSDNLQKAACIMMMTRHKKSYSTEYCTGTKKQSTSYNIPSKKRDGEGYQKLMESFGIPQGVIDKELVRIHWPSFKEYCADLEAEGERPPAGVDLSTATPVFSVAIRKKKEILE